MNVLVIGKGAREHALCWKISKSPTVKKLYCSPGSEGIGGAAECIFVADDEIEKFTEEKNIDLVVIGPETPLVDGMADRLRRAGVKVFGPGKEGARLEGSKLFSKKFMEKYGVPTAKFFKVQNPDDAMAAVDKIGDSVVVKADGLAAGKGVIVCSDRGEGREAVRRLMVQGEMGEAGKILVVEERLEGQEVSIIALCDGKNYCMLLPTQDHKRIFDDDKGPNTGGMGAYSPAEKVAPREMIEKIEKKVVIPTLEGMKKENIDFRGTLYCGLMISPEGEPNVLEFNVRFGDPETQPQMILLDEDLAELLMSAASGELSKTRLRWKRGVAVNVVISAEGYPGKVTREDKIRGLEEIQEDDEHVVFHAGTKKKEGKWITDGGRVLGVTAIGKNLKEAREKAYEMLRRIGWRGMHYRKDIGVKGM